MKIEVSKNLISLAKLFKKHAPLYIVGGYVRNAIIGIEKSDVDIASRLTPEQVTSILKDNKKFEVKEVYKKLGTMLIKCGDEKYEYTTFRKDNYNSTGEHSPKSVDFVAEIHDDAQRRDFCINAIYYDILGEEIVDVYSGMYDIKKKRIRTVETPSFVFEHDGLRILRMIRFACQLNFKVENNTLLTARRLVDKLKDITGSRKFGELSLILNSDTAYNISKKRAYLKGLRFFNLLNVWQAMYVPTNRVRYQMVNHLKNEYRLTGLLIDIINSSSVTSIPDFLENALGQKGFMLSDSQIKEQTILICGYFDALHHTDNKNYFMKYFDHFEKIAKILKHKSIILHNKYYFYYQYLTRHEIPINLKTLKLNGNDIKNAFPEIPEKKYGRIFDELLSKCYDGKVENTKEKLLLEIKNDFRNSNN